MTDDAAGHLLHNIFAAPAEPGPPYTHTIDLSPPDPAEAVAWLREQIEGDFARARYILDKRGAHPDPRREMHDAIADCEAKLAILDECLADASMDAALENGDISTEEYVSAVVTGTIILRLLASAYRHREGYNRFWGTPPTHTLTEAPGE